MAWSVHQAQPCAQDSAPSLLLAVAWARQRMGLCVSDRTWLPGSNPAQRVCMETEGDRDTERQR